MPALEREIEAGHPARLASQKPASPSQRARNAPEPHRCLATTLLAMVDFWYKRDWRWGNAPEPAIASTILTEIGMSQWSAAKEKRPQVLEG